LHLEDTTELSLFLSRDFAIAFSRSFSQNTAASFSYVYDSRRQFSNEFTTPSLRLNITRIAAAEVLSVM